jgi:Zn-dependent protease with chaperone function
VVAVAEGTSPAAALPVDSSVEKEPESSVPAPMEPPAELQTEFRAAPRSNSFMPGRRFGDFDELPGRFPSSAPISRSEPMEFTAAAPTETAAVAVDTEAVEPVPDADTREVAVALGIPISIAGLVGILWIFVAFVLLVRLARSWFALRKLCRGAVAVDDATARLCERLATSFGIPSPELRRSPFVSSPCVIGIRRPMILLGDDVAPLDAADVLAHELAHVARHDGLWNLLRQIATSCLFPQPLLWWLSRRLEATAEEICDDNVVRLGADRVRYVEQLYDLAVLMLPSPAATAIGMKTARRMLIHAFAGEIIERIRNPQAREELDKVVWERLEANPHLTEPE